MTMTNKTQTYALQVALLLTVLPCTASSQEAVLRVPAPNLVAARAAELSQADRKWRDADRGIETNLLGAKRNDMLIRLNEAESRMIERAEALRHYNEALLGQARQLLTDLEGGANSLSAAAGASAESAHRDGKQLRELNERILRLEARLAALPPPEPNATAAAAAERDHLTTHLRASQRLRDSLQNRAGFDATVVKLTREGAADRGPAIDQARSLVRGLERELEESGSETGLWIDYYTALRSLVIAGAPAKDHRQKARNRSDGR